MTAALPPDPAAFAAEFFRQAGDSPVFAQLFEVLPSIYLFVKDREGRFVKVNRAEALLHGCATEQEMIGHNDYEYHPPALAAQYLEEDRRVMETDRPLVDQVWLVQCGDGLPRWYLSSKFPVRGARGAVIGIAGVMRPYDQTDDAPGEYRRLTKACQHVLAHYGERVEVGDLAARAHLSVSQLQREFARLFGMTPTDYLLRVRLLMSRRALEHSRAPIGSIALECGFYDQSHFTRAFRAATGLRPLEYRRRFTPRAPRRTDAAPA